MKYQQFIFKNYHFEPQQKLLTLSYSYDNQLDFTETYRFDFDYVDYEAKVLDRALQMLFFVAGVSYYKAYVAPNISIEAGDIDEQTATFLAKTYQKGLGEFWYVNKLDPRTLVSFPVNSQSLATVSSKGTGLLVGVGGGKDSLVTVELLRQNQPIATWSLNHRSQLAPLVERIGLPHLWVEREWDAKLQELNSQDAMNGHVPISAIFACVGSVVAVLSGKQQVVVSNEQSANEPTLQYQGVDINHQYSKSQEFEQDYQAYLQHNFGDSLQYYSFLRPLSELLIARLFAKIGFAKYADVFSSCNRAFVHTSDHMWWCGECPKCAFVFLVLTPFVARAELGALWGGKNLLLDPQLEQTYEQLLGIAGDKPLDCVGEVKESRAAMRLGQAIYPELTKYDFELPADYDYTALASHHMPEELHKILVDAVTTLLAAQPE